MKRSQRKMDWKIIGIIVGVISSAIVGVYTLLYKHATKQNKHPCADRIVYEDTCEARRDCIEISVESVKEQLCKTEKNIKEDLVEIKQLIKDARS